jgi:hypothetical protein
MKTKITIFIGINLLLLIFFANTVHAIKITDIIGYQVYLFNDDSTGDNTCPETPFVTLIPEEAQVVGQDTIIACVYDTINIDPGPGYRYTWSNNSFQQQYRITTTGIGYDVQTHWVIAEDPEFGCADTAYITVIFSYTACATGISERYEDTFGEIYPNPGNGIFNLPIINDPGELRLEVVDMNGSLQYQAEYANNFQGSLMPIDLQRLPDGLYMIRIIGEDYIYNEKVIKN